MARQLEVSTGVEEYEINGVPVRFNPTDEGFVKRLYDSFDSLDGLQARLSGGEATLEAFAELDAEMRASIDGLLGEGVSEGVFGDMNCYALANGLPVWMNLVLALLDVISEAYEEQFGKSDERLAAHTRKYEAMMSKYRKGGR